MANALVELLVKHGHEHATGGYFAGGYIVCRTCGSAVDPNEPDDD